MGLELEQRRIERAGGVDLVTAPRHWTDARVEAWLDWAEGLASDSPAIDLPEALRPSSALDPVLGAGPDRYARRAAAWGLALKLFDAEAALAFREALFASLLAGEAAPAAALASGIRVNPFTGPDATPAPDHLTDLGDIEFARVTDAHLAAARGAEAARAGAEAVARALQAVISAVARCEGEAGACADPLRNPALGRAARAAREAGAPDALILDAIARARAGDTAYASSPALAGEMAQRAGGGAPPPLVLSAARAVAEAMSPEAHRAASAAWETGRVVLALGRRDAEAAQRALDAPKAALCLAAFEAGEELDLEALNRAVWLWTLALEIEASSGFAPDAAAAARRHAFRPIGLTLAGVPEALARQGLAYGSEAGRKAAQGLYALVTNAALAASEP